MKFNAIRIGIFGIVLSISIIFVFSIIFEVDILVTIKKMFPAYFFEMSLCLAISLVPITSRPKWLKVKKKYACSIIYLICKKLNYLTSNKDRLSKEYHLTKIGLFGSIARGDYKENSDIDIVVEFEPNTSDLYTLKAR